MQVNAVSPKAFEPALGMVGRGGAVLLNGVTVRGAIEGTRRDLQEAVFRRRLQPLAAGCAGRKPLLQVKCFTRADTACRNRSQAATLSEVTQFICKMRRGPS